MAWWSGLTDGSSDVAARRLSFTRRVDRPGLRTVQLGGPSCPERGLPRGSDSELTDAHSAAHLATCIETDPRCVASPLGLEDRNQHIAVHRERRATGRDRVGLLMSVDGRGRVLVEVKVLSGVGRGQLTWYGNAFSSIDHRVLLYPGRPPLDVSTASGGGA